MDYFFRKDLWCIVVGDSNGEKIIYSMMSNDSKKVAKYIRNNVEKLFLVFTYYYFCDENSGWIRTSLNDWYQRDDFLEFIKDEDNKKLFINDVKQILNAMTDDEILLGFDANDNEDGLVFVSLKHVSSKEIVYL